MQHIQGGLRASGMNPPPAASQLLPGAATVSSRHVPELSQITCARLERCSVCHCSGFDAMSSSTEDTSSSATSLGFSGDVPDVPTTSLPPTCRWTNCSLTDFWLVNDCKSTRIWIRLAWRERQCARHSHRQSSAHPRTKLARKSQT